MDTPITIASLHVYPVKSCAGVTLDETLLIETGFEFDRAWMVVDADGEFVSQRELPRMALVA
ncbi:MAG TPA: MOSC N-terminal beta barrel domain-containing protein, partial [Methylibium sp.]|nr:MOSC N-terminal beta barrel domain-containing protein [Methylibium sp.]